MASGTVFPPEGLYSQERPTGELPEDGMVTRGSSSPAQQPPTRFSLRSISARIVLVLSLVALAVLVLLVLLLVWERKELLTAHLAQRGMLLGSHLAESIGEALLRDEFADARTRMTARCLDLREELVFCTVFDRFNREIGHSGPVRLDGFLAEELRLAEPSGAEVRPSDKDGLEVLLVWQPIVPSGTYLGQVVLGVSLASRDREVRTLLLRALWLAVAIFALAFTAVVMVAGTVARPIRTLTHAISKVASGDLDQRLALERSDDLGFLARAFNNMVRQLKQTTVSKAYVDNIIESMADMLVVLDRGLCVRTINRSFLEHLGYRRDEVLGRSFLPFLESSPDAKILHREEFLELRHVRRKIHTAEGECVPVVLSVTKMPIPGAEGELIVCVLQDISALEKAQQELSETNALLVETAHRAGMAEIATGVLHDIGNILTSMVVSNEQILSHCGAPDTQKLGKATRLLLDHREDLEGFLRSDERGRLLPDYLSQVLRLHQEAWQAVQREAVQLREQIALIDEVLRSQQEHASSGMLEELVDLETLVQTALKIQQPSVDRLGLEVQLEAPPAGTLQVRVQRSKALGVILNLLKNACDALRETPRPRRILVSTHRNAQGEVVLKISDNGCGIRREHIAEIFRHGFTTKSDGHGFGLHTAALHLAEMGASITVASAGIGRGAVFEVRWRGEAEPASKALPTAIPNEVSLP